MAGPVTDVTFPIFLLVAWLGCSKAFHNDKQGRYSGNNMCAFVMDAGSTGNRILSFTPDNLSPIAFDQQFQGDACEPFHSFYALREVTNDKTKTAKTVNMADMVLLQALKVSKDPTLIPDKTEKIDTLISSGDVIKCFAETTKATVENLSLELGCRNDAKLKIFATAGVRSLAMPDAARDESVKGIDSALREEFRESSVTFEGFVVVSQEEEGRLEAEATQMAAQEMGVSKLSGVFSMGGASSQFTDFDADKNWSPKVGYNDLLNQDKVNATEIFAKALKDMHFTASTRLSSGMWAGISTTYWAAHNSGLPECQQVPYAQTLEALTSKLESEAGPTENFNDAQKNRAGMLGLQQMVETMFTEDTSFFFCRGYVSASGKKIAAKAAMGIALELQPSLLGKKSEFRLKSAGLETSLSIGVGVLSSASVFMASVM